MNDFQYLELAREIARLRAELESIRAREPLANVQASANPAGSRIPISSVGGNLDAWITRQFYLQTVVDLADDAAVSVDPPNNFGVVIVNARQSSYSGISGQAVYRCSVTPFTLAMFSGSLFSLSTSILTGTTGTDGRFTVSAVTGNLLYFENRTGGLVTFGITLLGA